MIREADPARGFGIPEAPSFAAVEGDRIERIVVGAISEQRLRALLGGKG